MLRAILCFVFGLGLVTAVNVDVVWTALGTHGGGPVSGPFTMALWRIARRMFGRQGKHRLLSFAGSVILALQLVLWTLLLWAGWIIVFSARDGALVSSQTHAPADLPSRVFFCAYMLSTMGNGDFSPAGHGWQFVASVGTLGGLGTLTLAISFVLQVLSAVVQKRQMAAYVNDLGAVPREILRCSWTGVRFDSLADHLVQLTQLVPLYTEQHLAYPVLLYYHSEDERTSATLRMASMFELVLLLRHGVAEEARMPPMVIEPLYRALQGFAHTIRGEWVDPADETPPPPSLSILRDLGIPAVSDAEFARAMADAAEDRRFFAGLVDCDARSWDRVHTPPGSGR